MKANSSDQGTNAEIDYTFHQALQVREAAFCDWTGTQDITVQGPVDREGPEAPCVSGAARTVAPAPSARSPGGGDCEGHERQCTHHVPRIIGIGLVTHQDGMANASQGCVAEKRQLWPWCRYLTGRGEEEEREGKMRLSLCGGRCALPTHLGHETGGGSKKKYFLQATTPLRNSEGPKTTPSRLWRGLRQPATLQHQFPQGAGGGRQ